MPEESGKDAASGERKIAFLAGYICSLAIGAGASDIHLEPQRHGGETHLRLRLRIDGLLHEVRRLPIRLHEALVLRYKAMAAMNAAERRLRRTAGSPSELWERISTCGFRASQAYMGSLSLCVSWISQASSSA